MKALIIDRYGPPEQLRIAETDMPQRNANEVLIRVRATTVNDFDWSLVRGKPWIYRLIFGLRKLKYNIPGIELSGIVEAVGQNVADFKAGDEVYGDISGHKWGTFAEYLCVDYRALRLKPVEMDFVTAASLPHASMLAWQALVDVGGIKEGQRILINGAGGGVGTLALQIAKTFNAEVTGVDSGDKAEMMNALGFDHVIDYRREDFTEGSTRFDLILDTKTIKSPSSYKKVLKPNGRYVTIGGSPVPLLKVAFTQVFINKRISLVALKPNDGLQHVEALYRSGKLRPVIDGPHPFNDSVKMFRHFGSGNHKGKVVVTLSEV